VVYGYNPKTPLVLTPIPTPNKFSWEAEKRAKEIKYLHAQVQERNEKSNNQAMHQANKHKREVHFQPGDLVWIHMRKERFPSKRKSKIMPRSDGPFEIMEKVGPNAYKVNLPGEYGVSATFNVADLSPYFEENEEIPSLRSNSNSLGGDDGNHPTKPFITLPNDPAPVRESKKVKKVHSMVRNHLNKEENGLSSSYRNWPGFVSLLEQNIEGENSYTHHPLKA